MLGLWGDNITNLNNQLSYYQDSSDSTDYNSNPSDNTNTPIGPVIPAQQRAKVTPTQSDADAMNLINPLPNGKKYVVPSNSSYDKNSDSPNDIDDDPSTVNPAIVKSSMMSNVPSWAYYVIGGVALLWFANEGKI
jgi:hypothetical protein